MVLVKILKTRNLIRILFKTKTIFQEVKNKFKQHSKVFILRKKILSLLQKQNNTFLQVLEGKVAEKQREIKVRILLSPKAPKKEIQGVGHLQESKDRFRIQIQEKGDNLNKRILSKLYLESQQEYKETGQIGESQRMLVGKRMISRIINRTRTNFRISLMNTINKMKLTKIKMLALTQISM